MDIRILLEIFSVQLRGNRGLMVAGTKNIESYYPNSIATYVNGQLWQKLLDR